MAKDKVTRKDNDIWQDSDGKRWQYHKAIEDAEMDTNPNEGVEDRARFRAYKMFRTRYNPNAKRPNTAAKGKLYPLYINATTSYEIGKWYRAGQGAFKTLVDECNAPVKDEAGNLVCRTIEKDLSFRPGLHMGSLPIMRQRGRKDLPHVGSNYDYFHSEEVFALVEFSGAIDYTEKSKERQRNSAHPDDPYEAGFTSRDDIKGGFYKFKTNTSALDDEVWYIADAMRIIRVLTDEEVEKIVKDSGTAILPQKRGAPTGKGSDKFYADFDQFKDLNLTENRRMNRMMFTEADKSRFIKKMWTDAGCDGVGCFSDFPLEDTIEFFNTHQELKVDWQSKETTIKTLWDLMREYGDKATKANFKKGNYEALFKNTTAKVVYDNDEFVFIVPESHKDCIYMDSFNCGGMGARWCIGYEGSSNYWENYTRNGKNMFCLAMKKDCSNKYMLQINISATGSKAWTPDDSPSNCIPASNWESFFGISLKGIAEKVWPAWDPDGVRGSKRKLTAYYGAGSPVAEVVDYNELLEAEDGTVLFRDKLKVFVEGDFFKEQNLEACLYSIARKSTSGVVPGNIHFCVEGNAEDITIGNLDAYRNGREEPLRLYIGNGKGNLHINDPKIANESSAIIILTSSCHFNNIEVKWTSWVERIHGRETDLARSLQKTYVTDKGDYYERRLTEFVDIYDGMPFDAETPGLVIRDGARCNFFRWRKNTVQESIDAFKNAVKRFTRR